MRPVILLTGKNGQLGSEFSRLLPQLGDLVAVGRGEMDLSKTNDIRGTIRNVQPQLIVNTAAYTAVDRAESDEATARAVNAGAPEVIAEEARQIGAAVVHFSTDYIFDGSKKSPYEESDTPNPMNVYGRTKLAGEEAVRGMGIPHLIFRTAWVYATRGKNFMLTILRLATERDELRVVLDQTGAPTCASDIASTAIAILRGAYKNGNNALAISETSGTYHMTAGGSTSWYDFADLILTQASQASQTLPWLLEATRGRPLIASRVTPITTKEFQAAAPRPAYSVLSNARLTRTFGLQLPDWRSQLHRCFAA